MDQGQQEQGMDQGQQEQGMDQGQEGGMEEITPMNMMGQKGQPLADEQISSMLAPEPNPYEALIGGQNGQSQ
jgi:hypothetical protein